jgi:hypothetical protein
MNGERSHPGRVQHLVLLIVIITGGCTLVRGWFTSDPVQDAQTPEQKAYAVYGEFATLAGSALTMSQDSNISAVDKETLKEAYDADLPIMDDLRTQAESYESLKTGGAPIVEQTTALATLNETMIDAEARVQVLRVLVGK